jgi:hypothetical protein
LNPLRHAKCAVKMSWVNTIGAWSACKEAN